MSQPPPQKVMSLPKSRLRPAASMPLQVICTGLIASSPASIRSGSSSRTPPHECSITLTFASSFARFHIRACRGLKSSRYMRGEICGPVCIPRSSPKRITSMYGPTSAQELLQVAPGDARSACPGTRRPCSGSFGQQHEEVVVAEEELADLQQVAAEQADDGAVGARAASAARPRPGCGRRPARR